MMPAYWTLAMSVIVLLALIATVFKFGNWYGEVNSDWKGFDQFMEGVHQELEEIRKDIKDIFHRLPPVPTTNASPIRLSELGERISEEIGAKA